MTHQPTNLADLTPHVIDADVASPYEVELAITSTSQIVDEVDLWIYAVGSVYAILTILYVATASVDQPVVIVDLCYVACAVVWIEDDELSPTRMPNWVP